MSIDPRRVAVQVALRTLQLQGVSQSALATAYTAGYTALDGADVPVGGLVDAVIAVEAELVEIIANDRAHPYRALFYGRTDDLPTNSEIPKESDELIPFTGIFSGVNDYLDHRPLTEGPIQEITRFLRGNYVSEVRKYKMVAGRLHHTRDWAYIEGCVWSREHALERLVEGTAVSALPTSLESTWVARTIEFLAQEGWLVQEGQYYGNFARTGIERLRGRDTESPQFPNSDSTSNPVAN